MEKSDKNLFNFNSCEQGFIFGFGGIGSALVENLHHMFPNLIIHIVSRSEQVSSNKNIIFHKIDDYNEESIARIIKTLEKGRVDFVINTIGQLNIDSISPEKSLRNFNIDNFLQNIKVNTGITLLIAKIVCPLLAKDKAVLFASLSALVGSINDNKLGGWYSYRASKAALNMVIRNIGLELKRSHPQIVTVAVHPGTTKTSLTDKYLANVKHDILSTDQSAKRLINFFNSLSNESNGEFYHANGQKLPW